MSARCLGLAFLISPWRCSQMLLPGVASQRCLPARGARLAYMYCVTYPGSCCGGSSFWLAFAVLSKDGFGTDLKLKTEERKIFKGRNQPSFHPPFVDYSKQ